MMKKLFVVGFYCLLPLVVIVPQKPKPDSHSVQVRIVNVVDGDTYDVVPVNTLMRVRLSNADTWESRRVRRAGSSGISDEELAKGIAAKKAVENLAARSSSTSLVTQSDGNKPSHLDAFGRTLGEIVITSDGKSQNLGDWLRENGHTRP